MDKSNVDVDADDKKVATSQIVDDVATGWEDVPNGCHVRTLDETNFQETIGGNRCVLVFFHAKWCSACTPFRPVYADAAFALRRDGCAEAAAVDCTRDFALALTCGVRSLPAVVAFTSRGRRATQYDGDRSADDLRRFVCRALQAAADADGRSHAPAAAVAGAATTTGPGRGGPKAAVRGKKPARRGAPPRKPARK